MQPDGSGSNGCIIIGKLDHFDNYVTIMTPGINLSGAGVGVKGQSDAETGREKARGLAQRRADVGC